jgi:hypothetical protein
MVGTVLVAGSVRTRRAQRTFVVHVGAVRIEAVAFGQRLKRNVGLVVEITLVAAAATQQRHTD